MRPAPSVECLREAQHLTSQIDTINGRAIELENLIRYIQAWVEVFRADSDFATGRVEEIKRSIASCESLVDRARSNTLTVSDPISSPVIPLISATSNVSGSAADPSVAVRLNDLVSGLQAATREVINICEERQSETHEILVKSETLYRSEKSNLEQWEFLKNDLIRKESAFLAFSAIISGAAADYRCTISKLEERIGVLLSAATASI